MLPKNMDSRGHLYSLMLLRYYSVVYIMAKCLLFETANKTPINLSFAAVRNVYHRLSRTFSSGNVDRSVKTRCFTLFSTDTPNLHYRSD